MNIIFSWLEEEGVIKVIDFVYKIIEVIRIIVPIGLIVMTTLDITKKVINPQEKEGQKKIMIRFVAAIIVFLAPLFIRLVFKLGDIDIDNLKINDNSGSNNNNNNNNSNVNNTNKITDKISSIVIKNCPSLSQSYKPGDRITLNTDIPSSYNGNIKWIDDSGSKVFNIIPSNDKKSATLEVLKKPANSLATVFVEADGVKGECTFIVKDSKELSNVSITDCPEASKNYHQDDSITLNTDIPSTYQGDIIWSVTKGNKYASVIPSSDKRSSTIKILKVEYDTAVTIQVVANGKSSSCNINIQEEKLDNISILNCDHSARYVVGDIITFNTSIPASFKGDVKWKFEDDVLKIKDASKKDKVEFEVINRPTKGYSVPLVSAGGKSAACTIEIASVKKLEANCPNKSQIYYVGDKIHIKSNLPTTYNGTINWSNGVTTPGTFKISPTNNGREVDLEVLKIPENGVGYIALIADNDSTTCNIKIN